MSRTIVGIDIGATGIRAVEAVVTGRDMQVRKAGAVPLTPGAVSGGVIKDAAAVASALKQLRRKSGITSRKVATVVGADPAVLIRPASVPYVADAKDRRGVVLAAAPEALPVEVDHQYLDHHIVGVRQRANEDGTQTTVADIALVAADRGCVDTVVAAIEGAGLQPVSIDVTAFALSRFVAMASSGPGHLDVICHIGADTISIIGVLGGQPAFQRALNEFSGARVTASVQEHLGCPPEVAENLKVTFATLTGADAAAVAQVVAVWTNATVGQIKTVIVEAARARNTPLGRVWLSGGGARLATLGPQLKAQLGVGATVAILEPATWLSKPDRLVKATEATGQDFTVALAAAAR